MYSLFLLAVLPYAGAFPLGNAYNAIYHPYDDNHSPAKAPSFMPCPGAPIPAGTVVPIPTGTGLPPVNGSISAFPVRTLPPSSPRTLNVNYRLAPRLGASEGPVPSARIEKNLIRHIYPRHGRHRFPPFGCPSGPRGTNLPAYPFPTGFPAFPPGRPFPFPFPTARPTALPTGSPVPSRRPTGSFPFPSVQPSAPIPTGDAPSSTAPVPSFSFVTPEPFLAPTGRPVPDDSNDLTTLLTV